MSIFPTLPAEQRNSLLAALKADAGSDEPFLIFADWLEDHGDPRAELIRLQCERGKLHVWNRRFQELLDQEEDWLDRCREAWVGRMPEGIELNWDRGLIDATISLIRSPMLRSDEVPAALKERWLARLHVAVDSGDQADRLRWILGSLFESVTGLFLGGCTGKDLDSVRRLPWLERLRLWLRTWEEADLKRLTGLSCLRELDLGENASNRGLRLLVKQGILDSVRDLRLDQDHVTDEGCLYLEGLPVLEKLALSRTTIEGRGLGGLASCPRLHSLNLEASAIGDVGLEQLAPLTGLVELDLSSTAITDAGLPHLAGLIKLRKLDLWSTPIQGWGLAHLTGLRSLEWLNLAETSLSGSTMSSVGELTTLRYLDLRGTEVTGSSLAHLKGLERLEWLSLPFGIAGDGLKHLARLKSLHSLELAGAQLKDADLRHLKSLTGLRHLDLTASTMSGAALVYLRPLSGLVGLSLDRTPITDGDLVHLAGLTQLRQLSLRRTSISDEGVQHLLGLTSLRKLAVDGTQLTDRGLARLRELPHLRELSAPIDWPSR